MKNLGLIPPPLVLGWAKTRGGINPRGELIQGYQLIANNRTGQWASQKDKISLSGVSKSIDIPLMSSVLIFFNYTFFEAELAVGNFRAAKKITSGACVTRISTCADLCKPLGGCTLFHRQILRVCRTATSLFCRNLW